VENDGVVVVVGCPVAGAGAASPLGDGPVGASPPSWTAFYPAKARTLARAAPRGVAFRRIAAPQITITTSLVIRDDSPDARAFLQAFRTCAL
jgi:hypothetical protein